MERCSSADDAEVAEVAEVAGIDRQLVIDNCS